jgi:hypothetical protein
MRTAHLTAAWALLFAIVHVYWAAGGEAGMNGEAAETAAEQAYVGFVAALGLAGAAVALALGRAPRRAALLLARAGGAALLIGVAIGTGRWLAEGGLGGDGAEGVAITAYFLAGGLLFLALGRQPVNAR